MSPSRFSVDLPAVLASCLITESQVSTAGAVKGTASHFPLIIPLIVTSQGTAHTATVNSLNGSDSHGMIILDYLLSHMVLLVSFEQSNRTKRVGEARRMTR